MPGRGPGERRPGRGPVRGEVVCASDDASDAIRPADPELHLWRRDSDGRVTTRGCSRRVASIATTAEAAGFDSVWVMDHLFQIPGMGRGRRADVRGVHPPRGPGRPDPTRPAGGHGDRGDLPQPGPPGQGGDGPRRPVRWARRARHRCGLVRGRARGPGLRLPPAHGALRPPRGGAGHLPGHVHRGRPELRGPLSTGSTEPSTVLVRSNRGGPPILIGGSGERRTLRLVAEHADACNLFGDVDTVRHKLDVLARHCDDIGRDPATITKTRLGTLVIAGHREGGRAQGRRPAVHPGHRTTHGSGPW